MNSKTVTISKEKYKHFKKLEKIDQELLAKIARGIENIKAGRIKKFA